MSTLCIVKSAKTPPTAPARTTWWRGGNDEGDSVGCRDADVDIDVEEGEEIEEEEEREVGEEGEEEEGEEGLELVGKERSEAINSEKRIKSKGILVLS